MEPWWKRGVIYQIYPLSFQDTDGDGKGDLEGIRHRLDYLAWLGIDAIWISPIYPSPMKDCGYDIADYVDVAPAFGTLAQFDALVAAARARRIRVLLDFVPNHTSDRHPWFRESRASRDNPRRDWYLWRDPAPGGGPPNNWLSTFGGPAWTFDATTGQYYYHAFLKEQPDLNWRNPHVRAAMYDVLRFWIARGVDGFRIDALWHIVKDARWRDDPPNPGFQPGDPASRRVLPIHSCDQPEIMEILAEMRRVVEPHPECVLIGEVYLPLERLVAYYGVGGTGVHLPFNFNLILAPWNAASVSGLIADYERLIPPGEWPNWVLGNHDRSRIASRVGDAQARVAAVLLLTLRGTPTMYYGDEIGMLDVTIAPERLRDTWTTIERGIGIGRDPERTPMHWDGSPNAGFSSAEPWLPIDPGYAQRNVAEFERQPRSILWLYRRLIALRRRYDALTVGAKRLIAADPDLVVYERTHEGQRLLVALNLGSRLAATPAVSGIVLLSTHLDRDGERVDGPLALRADEAVVIELA